MSKSHWAAFVFILILVAGLLATNVGVDEAVGQGDTAQQTQLVLAGPPPVGEPAQNLIDLAGWINTGTQPGPPAAGATGSVRLVIFWSANCDYCLATLDDSEDIAKRWGPRGLVTIAVHSPQSRSTASEQTVSDAADSAGWTLPVALDNDKSNLEQWQGSDRFWPRTYVVDQNGVIRFDHVGQGAYQELEATIAYLIENGP